ncbi:hypothetical protein HPB50_014278 [Hyalomma asiaticum]|uniref:Uncharacterized protein n=1 Tax=Hyalomma asiaticum TaxID=266040 RepID=A0ACB7S317_HYAAI|nr:hypothetical protein HPB50_014278 [Hyalomma asiaticum]
MEGGESVSEVGSVVGSSNGNVLSERQMEYHLKLAQERRQALELEVELARLHSTASSSSQERVGRAGEHGATSEWRKYAKILIGAFPKFPADAEVPVWFESVEHTLEAYEAVRGQQTRNAVGKNMEKAADTRTGGGLGQSQVQNTKPKTAYTPGKPQRQAVCFECGSTTHIRPNCPRVRERLAQAPATSGQSERLTARVSIDEATAGDRLWRVAIDHKGRTLNAIVDTGAEITVVRESALPEEATLSHGSVCLRAAFGERVEAKLVELPLTLKEGKPVFRNVAEATPVLCAVTDRIGSLGEERRDGEIEGITARRLRLAAPPVTAASAALRLGTRRKPEHPFAIYDGDEARLV